MSIFNFSYNENVSFDNPEDALKYAEDKLRNINAEIDSLFTTNPFNAKKNSEKIPGRSGYCQNVTKYRELMNIKSNYERSIKEIKNKLKQINEKVTELKLSIYEYCINGSISKDERNNLLSVLEEKSNLFNKIPEK